LEAPTLASPVEVAIIRKLLGAKEALRLWRQVERETDCELSYSRREDAGWCFI